MIRRAQVPSRKPWRAGTAIAAVAAVLAAGCGSGSSGTATASRYSSARQIVAALDHAGLRCTGAYYGTPQAAGASSEAVCNFGYSASAVIDVFPGTLSAGVALQNSVSTGPERIWNVAGPNWSVQTSHYYAGRVQAILGGHVIAGPQAAPVATPPPPADPGIAVCQKFLTMAGQLTADLSVATTDPAAVTGNVRKRLKHDASLLTGWSYIVTQAVANGTSVAPIQLANHLSDAGIATIETAFIATTKVTSSVPLAIAAVGNVEGDCSSLTG